MKNGVLDLLTESTQKRSLSQALLEWNPFIRIYEGRLWRKGLFFPALLGISLEREFDIMLQAAKLKGHESLLDLACGTGVHARAFAKRLSRGSVVGVDLSLPMLNHASKRARNEGLENLILIHANALDLPFPGEEFDVVNCSGAIHLFTDLSRALSEIVRVLKPGGPFISFTFLVQPGRISAQLVRICRQVSGVHSFRPQELEWYFKQAGLYDIACHHAKRMGLLMSAVKPS